jgi:hypothetical protein
LHFRIAHRFREFAFQIAGAEDQAITTADTNARAEKILLIVKSGDKWPTPQLGEPKWKRSFLSLALFQANLKLIKM